MKKWIFIFHLLSISAFANECNETVQDIYENIITSIGNNSLYPPELHFSDDTRSVAYMSSKGITIEQKTIDLFCGKDNFEDKIAYIIAHELAHYYLEHSWMSNTGLSYASSIGEFVEDSSSLYSEKQKKLSESQADLYAGFYGQIAGYNTLMYAKQTLTAIYEAYALPKELRGYPSFDERLLIIDSKKEQASNLAIIFELGNVLLMSKKFKEAKDCYTSILKSKFNSREIYNNLGLSYLLFGISISDESIAKLVYPVFIDQQTRAEISTTRSSSFNNSPKKMFINAERQFKRAIDLDANYKPAQQNLFVCQLLMEITKEGRGDVIKSILKSDLDSETIIDFKVVSELINNTKFRKVKKLAKKGSYLSLLNTTKPTIADPRISDEEVLKRLGIDFTDLLMGSPGRRIKGSNFKLKVINGTDIFEHKNFYILKIPITKCKTLFNEREGEVFTPVLKNNYFYYTFK